MTANSQLRDRVTVSCYYSYATFIIIISTLLFYSTKECNTPNDIFMLIATMCKVSPDLNFQ